LPPTVPLLLCVFIATGTCFNRLLCRNARINEESLRVFERKVLRRIFGAVCENGFWHIRYYSELYELFSEPDIVKTIKIGRL
jgi:hypothetical protein